MEILNSMFLFANLFQENRLYHLENFHCLVHLINWKYKHFFNVSYNQAAGILDDFFKDIYSVTSVF